MYYALREVLGGLIILVILVGLIFRSRYFHNVPIWTIMSLAAFIAIVGGLVKPNNVESYVNWDVILFLIGMFSIGALAEESGLLEYVTYAIAYRVNDRLMLVVALTAALGLMAALTVNDAVAAMGSMIIVPMAKMIGIDPELAILVLAFSITIGSTMTPLGNPQNMLIAIGSGVRAPLSTFLLYLGVPTVVNLLVTGYILAKIYGVSHGKVTLYKVPEEAIKSRRDAMLAAAAIIIVIAALAVDDALELLRRPALTEIGVIPFTVAAIIYVLSSNPRDMISRVNWSTILFFIVMFIAMAGVWDSGVLLPLMHAFLPAVSGTVDDAIRITASSLVLSQVLSNVPFVELFMIYMQSIGFASSNYLAWLTLAMASTIAGNLTILGAASNVIILETTEARYGVSVSYWKFMKIGSLVTLINVIIYLAYIIPLALVLHIITGSLAF
ncbi:MAG: SLC13 family permease [Acidilobus sp.]